MALCRYLDSAPRPVLVSGSPAARATCRVNLNTADAARLQLLPGIGPVTAKALIEYRLRHGPFRDISDLQRVGGIGPGKTERIRPYVTLSDDEY